MNRFKPKNNSTTGQRNRRVTIISVLQEPDGMGGFALTQQAELQAWARIRRLWGSEAVVAGALAGRQTVEVFIPSSDAARQITTDMILHDPRTGQRFNIRDVSESEDRAEVRLLCESGVPT
jgi:head-tail adaptor